MEPVFQSMKQVKIDSRSHSSHDLNQFYLINSLIIIINILTRASRACLSGTLSAPRLNRIVSVYWNVFLEADRFILSALLWALDDVSIEHTIVIAPCKINSDQLFNGLLKFCYILIHNSTAILDKKYSHLLFWSCNILGVFD